MAVVEAVKPKRRTARFGNRGGLAGYFFVAPSIFFLILFVVVPIFGALWYSFSDYDLMSAPRWVGLRNYNNLLDDYRYPAAIRNTLAFAFGTVPTGVVTSLFLAMLIDRKIRGIYTFRALFYMPVVSSFVAVYNNLLDDYRYPAAIRNTLAFAFGTVPTGVVTSLFLAMLIDRKIRGIYTFRALFYMPVVSSFVAVSLIWLWFYDVQIGLFNDVFEGFRE